MTNTLRQFHRPLDDRALVAGPLHVAQGGTVTMSIPASVVAELIYDDVIEQPEDFMHDLVEGWLGIRTEARALFTVHNIAGPGYASPPPARTLPFIGDLAIPQPLPRWLLTVKPWSPK